MKYHYKKVIFGILCILVQLLLSGNSGFAQSTGDYESNSTGGGTWNIAATWLIYNGTSYVPAAVAPSSITNNIIIQSGDVVTITDNETLGANITVNGSLTVTGSLACGTNNVLGTGSFILNGAATLSIASIAGISTTAGTGNIQVTGSKTFNAGANYTYSGSVLQVTGNALPSILTGTLSFGNSNASGTSLSNNLVVNSPGIVTVTGALACNTYIISGTGTFSLSSGSTLLTANAAGISSTGASGSIQTSVVNFNSASNYIYYGSVSQVTGTGLPATIVSLTVNNSSAGGVSLTNSVTLNGVLTLTNGIFCLNGQTFTLPSGRTIVRQKGSLSLCGGTIALTGIVNVNYTGTTAITTGLEIPATASGLGNLSINGTGVVVTLGANATINGNLTMTIGALLLGGFTLSYGVSAQLIYNGTAAQTVGPEWPGASFSQNISISNSFASSGVTLNANKTNYSGTITVNAVGFFNSGSFTLGGTGNINLNAGGTFITPNANGIGISGAIQLTGTQTFASGSSYTFDGTLIQATGAGMPSTVKNLTLNNTTGIQLTNAVVVAGNLTMTQGNFDLNGKNLTLGISALSPGTLNYTSGTLINTGSFTRWFAAAIIASGSSSGLFPVGNINNYQPLYISAPLAPTTGGTVTLSYTYVSGNKLVSFPDGAATVAVIKNLNWALSTANGLSGGNFSLDAGGTGLGTIGNVADLRLILAGSAIGTAGINAGTIANPQVNTTNLSLANLNNTFFIGSVNYANSDLPVKFLSFTASVINTEVQLNWSTATELNDDNFTVQRSKDGRGWENIEQVAGSGSSGTASSYATVDPHPYPRTSFYRLMDTDPDGSTSFSAIRTILVEAQLGISLYPNPTSDQVRISFLLAAKYEVSVLNCKGQSMISPISFTGNLLALSVMNFPDGLYFVRINSLSNTTIFKLVILK